MHGNEKYLVHNAALVVRAMCEVQLDRLDVIPTHLSRLSKRSPMSFTQSHPPQAVAEMQLREALEVGTMVYLRSSYASARSSAKSPPCPRGGGQGVPLECSDSD